MLTDARSIPAGHLVQTDVCIVGGGAAGITLALALVDRSINVTLLEGGGLDPEDGSQQLNQGIVDGRPYYPLDRCRLRLLGGSTNFWGGWCRPLDAVDFEAREWVPYSGWPLAKADMDPFYARAQNVCKSGPYDYATRNWFSTDQQSLVDTLSPAVTETMFQIGPTRFGRRYHAALRRARNIDLMLHGNAVEIEMDGSHGTVRRSTSRRWPATGFPWRPERSFLRPAASRIRGSCWRRGACAAAAWETRGILSADSSATTCTSRSGSSVPRLARQRSMPPTGRVA